MTNIVAINGSVKLYKRFQNGVISKGDNFEVANSINDELVQTADAFFQNNMLKSKFLQPGIITPYEYILKTNKPFLVVESPNFRKYVNGWQRLGWYSYKWAQGVFGNKNSPGDRWKKFQQETGIVLHDWRSPGDKIIIMGQKEGDSSLVDLYNKGYSSFYEWVQESIIEIRKYSDREIIIRPHPRGLSSGIRKTLAVISNLDKMNIKNVQLSDNLVAGGNQGGPGLDADLQQAHCVVTYNSLSGVESVVDGIPTFVGEDGSMVWPVAHKSFSQIENLNYDIDRTQWSYDIMYTQWDNNELASGEAWEHLKPLMFK